MNSPAVAVSGLRAGYSREGVIALADLDLRVFRGERVALIGPSGCGKTTLLMVLAGLLPPLAGDVAVMGEPVRRGRLRTALILQENGLLPWKTAAENVALGLRIRGAPGAARDAAVADALRRVGLDGLGGRYPARLSGGQRQRVGIARALTLQPDLLLMDEPFSALDAFTRESLHEVLLDVWRELGAAMLLVTHSIDEAAYLGQRIAVMGGFPGRIRAWIDNPLAGTPGLRRSDGFHRTCVLLRDALEDVAAGVAAGR